MARPKVKKRRWPAPRTVALKRGQTPTGGILYRVKTPDGKIHPFNNQEAADAFIDETLLENPTYYSDSTDNNASNNKNTSLRKDSSPKTSNLKPITLLSTQLLETPAQPSLPISNPVLKNLSFTYNTPEWARPFNRWTNENIPWLNKGMTSFGNFVNDEILLNRDNVRAKNAHDNPEVMDAIEEGGDIAAKTLLYPLGLVGGAAGAIRYAPLLLRGAGWLVNTAGRAMMPSEWASGLASYSRLAPYADKIKNLGLWGDALLGSYFAAKGAEDVASGIYNKDTALIALGGLDLMMAHPYMLALRGSQNLVPALSLTLPSKSTNFLGKVGNFVNSPRTAAVGNSLAFGTLAAYANTPEEFRYKTVKDSNGNVLRNPDGTPQLELDSNGKPIPVYPGFFQTIGNMDAEDIFLTGVMAAEGIRGGWKWAAGKPRAPKKYTIGTGENATTKRARDLPPKPAETRPVYEPTDRLPYELEPPVVIYPYELENKLIPKFSELFEEILLLDPRSTTRISSAQNPRMYAKGELAEGRLTNGTLSLELVEELKRLERVRETEKSMFADDVAAYEALLKRLAEYNKRKAEADAKYNSPEQVQARAEYEEALEKYNKGRENYHSEYDKALEKYNKEQEDAFNSTTRADWDKNKAAWDEYYNSPEYVKYQDKLDRRGSVRDWIKDNKWSLIRWPLYLSIYGGVKYHKGLKEWNTAADPSLYKDLFLENTKSDALKMLNYTGKYADSLDLQILKYLQNSNTGQSNDTDSIFGGKSDL